MVDDRGRRRFPAITSAEVPSLSDFGHRQAVPTVVDAVDELANRRQAVAVQPAEPAEVPPLTEAARLVVDVAMLDLVTRLGGGPTVRPTYDLIDRGDGRVTLMFAATIDVVGLNTHAETMAKPTPR